MAIDEVRNEYLTDLLIGLLIMEAHLAKASDEDVTEIDKEDN